MRPIEDRGWDFLHGGNVPALVADGGLVPPVAVMADIPVVYGEDGPLLVDLAAIPGRGVRVPSARLGEILATLLDGTLEFDHLVRDMDVHGMYQGDGGRQHGLTSAGKDELARLRRENKILREEKDLA